jgi:hypothetical protein
MMKKVFIAVLALVTFADAALSKEAPAVGEKASEVAIVLKAIKQVDYRETDKSWSKAQRGQRLNSGDDIRTGEGSFSILRFIDGTVIRVREKSEVKVRGEKNPKLNMYDKSVELSVGKVGFNVKKHQNEQFRFTSPTAVATIKGTSGIWGGNLLIITESGSSPAAILEALSGLKQRVEIYVGETGFVNQDGSVGKRKSSKADLEDAKDATGLGEDAKSKKKVIIKFRTKEGDLKEVEVAK